MRPQKNAISKGLERNRGMMACRRALTTHVPSTRERAADSAFYLANAQDFRNVASG
jgi:hypothetical protein